MPPTYKRPVGTQRCDNVVTTSQIGCDVIQPKPDLHTTLIDVDNFIGCVPTDILRCIDVEIKSLVFIILRTKILISIQIKHHHSHILIVIMCNNVFCSNENQVLAMLWLRRKLVATSYNQNPTYTQPSSMLMILLVVSRTRLYVV